MILLQSHTPSTNNPFKYKINCSYADQDDWDILAMSAVKLYPWLASEPFYKIESMSEEGFHFAEALTKILPATRENMFTLLVNDVYTTGDIFKKYCNKPYGYLGLVAFAQEPIREGWIYPVWKLGR